MISVSAARPDGTRLTYTNILDAPVTQSESGEIRQQMFQQLTQQQSPAANNSFRSFRIACGQGVEQNDPNQGKFNLRLQCFPEYAVLNWGFKLAPALQVTVRGAVVEDGMTYFRNGEYGGKNSPHRYGSYDYFHGTMNPLFARDHISYQDMFKWRNNRASTTVLVIAGSAHLG